ncbi:MAG: TauD/TfdA family dioxygenase [Pseudomonadota bacterium]
MQVTPLHPHIGAEITDIDLARELDEDTFAGILAAFNRYSVLAFPDQPIDDDQQVRFSARFGKLEKTSFAVGANNPYIYQLSNIDDAGKVLPPDSSKRNFLLVNARWHTDSSFREIPALASILSARLIPAKEGGNTEFASMRVGYQTLPQDRRDQLKGLIGIHHYAYSVGLFGETGVTQKELDALPPASHPLVRTHPGSGEPSLYVSGHIRMIEGLPEKEGRELAEELVSWCTREEFVYRHVWRPNEIVMWDNRCALHRVAHVPLTERRIMHRTTVAGDGPVS